MEFILEILSEEIPPSMQENGVDTLIREFCGKFGVSADNFGRYYGSRRICVYSKDASWMNREAVRGPRVGSDERAIAGFATKMSSEINSLKIAADQSGVKYYYAEPDNNGACIAADIEKCISAVSWPRSIHWNETGARWARPVRKIMCILDGRVLPVEFAGVMAGETTIGRDGKEIKVESIEQYVKDLHLNRVISCGESRRHQIIEQLSGECAVIDNKRLYIAANTVEYPKVIKCGIDKMFLSLPEPVLHAGLMTCGSVISSKNRSEFFVVTDVANPGDDVVHGYERAINSRLADLALLWERDINTAQNILHSRSDAMTYHAQLGNYKQKTERITGLAAYMAVYVPYSCIESVKKAAAFIKLDASMSIVREYPELQGAMAAHYLEHCEKGRSLIDTLNAYGDIMNGRSITDPSAICLGLADMLDSLFTFFAIGHVPTTSRDPFRLKKTADSIIDIIIRHRLARLHVNIVLQRTGVIAYKICKSAKVSTRKVVDDVSKFLLGRLKVMLAEKISSDICGATIKGDDILAAFDRAHALGDFISSSKGKEFIVVYKRAISFTDDAKVITLKMRLTKGVELILRRKIAQANILFAKALKSQDFVRAIEVLRDLSPDVGHFLDNTLINVDDQALRAQRISLLTKFVGMANSLCDFSQLI